MTYLHKEQLQALSKAKRRTRIVVWLKSLGVRYIEDANGWPIVEESALFPKTEASKKEPRLNLA